jgi:hypothetical protein
MKSQNLKIHNFTFFFNFKFSLKKKLKISKWNFTKKIIIPNFTFFLIPIFTLKKTQNRKMRLILKNPLVWVFYYKSHGFLVFYTKKPISKKTVPKIVKLHLEILRSRKNYKYLKKKKHILASWSFRSRITGSALKLNFQGYNLKLLEKKTWSIF